MKLPFAYLQMNEFKIDEVYRFEGSTDPADEAVVFAISSAAHPIKGIIIDAFGMYADSRTSKIMQHLHKRL